MDKVYEHAIDIVFIIDDLLKIWLEFLYFLKLCFETSKYACEKSLA